MCTCWSRRFDALIFGCICSKELGPNGTRMHAGYVRLIFNFGGKSQKSREKGEGTRTEPRAYTITYTD